MKAAEELSPKVGVAPACESLGVPRASFYRQRCIRGSRKPREDASRRSSHRALSEGERQAVLSVLHEERFIDLAPAQVYARFLDDGKFLCSIRTMYRILEAQGEVRERRDQLRHPQYVKPELVATGPNQVWTWDITKLLGPVKWTYYYLYVILDMFSRYAVGWMLASRESAALAKELIEESCRRQGIREERLTLHSDRGTAMTSKSVALLLADLGVTKSHSRPHVSDDNPYSEAHFKTLKYRPEFPRRFGSIQHGRSFCRAFFPWYNHEHYHTGIGLLTPAMVHSGQAAAVLQKRHDVLEDAYAKHPERFVRHPPRPQALPPEVWINNPVAAIELEEAVH